MKFIYNFYNSGINWLNGYFTKHAIFQKNYVHEANNSNMQLVFQHTIFKKIGTHSKLFTLINISAHYIKKIITQAN
jgi:hypothetical protein